MLMKVVMRKSFHTWVKGAGDLPRLGVLSSIERQVRLTLATEGEAPVETIVAARMVLQWSSRARTSR